MSKPVDVLLTRSDARMGGKRQRPDFLPSGAQWPTPRPGCAVDVSVARDLRRLLSQIKSFGDAHFVDSVRGLRCRCGWVIVASTWACGCGRAALAGKQSLGGPPHSVRALPCDASTPHKPPQPDPMHRCS